MQHNASYRSHTCIINLVYGGCVDNLLNSNTEGGGSVQCTRHELRLYVHSTMRPSPHSTSWMAPRGLQPWGQRKDLANKITMWLYFSVFVWSILRHRGRAKPECSPVCVRACYYTPASVASTPYLQWMKANGTGLCVKTCGQSNLPENVSIAFMAHWSSGQSTKA